MPQANLLMIPVGDIYPDPSQPRQHFEPDAIERMMNSVRAKGVLQPVRVRKDAERGCWLLVSGECRWRAAKLAGLSEMPALPVEGELSEIDILSEQLIENEVRNELKPIELAKSLVRLQRLKGCTAEKLAGELGISGASVSRAAKLLTLPEEIQALIEDGSIPADSGYHLSKLPDEAAQFNLAHKIAAGKVSRDAVAEAVHEQLPAKTKKPTPERATYRLTGGVTFTVSASTPLTLGLLIAAIDQLKKQAESLSRKDKDISELAASLAAPAATAKAKAAQPATQANHPPLS